MEFAVECGRGEGKEEECQIVKEKLTEFTALKTMYKTTP